MNHRAERRPQQGFSLVEMMAVVTITGILAVVAWASMRKYLISSRGNEAKAVIAAIRNAEIAYLAENHVYLNVSTESGGLAWYPRQAPDKASSAWRNSGHPDAARWLRLAPSVNRSVQFGYIVNAGVSGTAFPATQVPGAVFPVGNQTRDWYVVQAKGDTDGNGLFATFASTSVSGEIYGNSDD